MGVTGLSTLMERLTKEANRPPLDLGKIALEYARNGSRVTLLVDQSVLMQITTPPNLTDQLLPSYSRIDSVISKFVLDYERYNINLVFYFDSTAGSPYELHKQLESIKRREQDIDNIIDLEDFINNNSGERPKNDFLPWLFRWQCLRTLERLRAKTVLCLGEADFALSVDGCFDGVYGILAFDSDFFICKGIKYIPFNTVQHVDNTILCQSYTTEDTAQILGVPVDSFVDLAILSGNDYTRNLKCWHDMRTKHASPENTIGSALNAIKTSNALLTTYKQLLVNNEDMKHVYSLSCNLYGFTFTTTSSMNESPDDYMEMLRLGVQTGRFPYSTLAIARNGILSTGVLPETLTGPTAADIVRPLIGAIFILLGRTDGTLLARKGAHYEKQDFSPLDVVTIPFPSIPSENTSVYQRFVYFHDGILRSFPCIKNLLDDPPFSGSGKSSDFNVLPPEKLNIFTVHPYHFTELACIYMVASSFQNGDPITRADVAALVACRVILYAAKKANAQVTTVSHYHNKAPPPMRLISVISRYQVVLHNIKDLAMLVGLFGEWIASPAQIFDGHLFAALHVPSLEEEELEEVMIDRVNSAIDSNSIKFSMNREQAIAEIQAAMENEFGDSYFEVLHAFGGALPGTDASAPKEDAVEFEYTAPTPLRDTVLHMDSPIQYTSLLTPQHPASHVVQRDASIVTPTKVLRFDDNTASPQQQQQQALRASKEMIKGAKALDALDSGATAVDEPLPAYNHKVLPIVAYIDRIAQTIRDNPVTIIQGETGCGKSSGVPQILLDKVTLTGNKKPFIVVTQPRRIAAMSLSSYVSKLRGDRAKYEIGYAVGNDRSYTEDCTLLFVTTGWLLQKLVFNSWFFEKCTHIVLDEVHERSVDADLLFLVVKQLFQQSFNERWKENGTRLILMSATFNSETFGSYFSMPGYPMPDPIFVGVQRYPTEIYYLDDLLDNKAVNLNGIPYGEHALTQLSRKIENSLHNTSSAPLDKMIELCVYICGRIALHHRNDEGGNCIIVFLPGIMEIEQMVDSLKEILGGKEEENYMSLIVLHSMVEKEDQMRAFDPLEPCVTRLVLSTNIAESSITLPMVRYVLDLGMHKQMFHSVKYNSPCLMGMWVSQASSMQRSGRAGRLFPGTIFRIYSRNFYSMLPAYDPPEILRISLDSTLLRLLVLGEQSGGGPFESPSAALAQALDPPTDESVDSAYKSLLQVGAIVRPGETDMLADRANKDGVALTSLGQFLTHIPFDLRVGRMVAFGAIVGKYLPHTLVMASALSLQEVFLMPNFMKGDSSLLNMVSSTQRSRVEFDKGSFSDCVASVRIYAEYIKARRRAKSHKKSEQGKVMFWCRDNGIHFKRMKLLVNTVSEVAKRIIQSDPQYTKYLSQLCKQGENAYADEQLTCLPLEDEDVAILKLILVNTFSSNIVIATIKRAKDVPMHSMIEIGKVPGKVMSETFKSRVENLTEKFCGFGYENTTAPKKKKANGKEKDESDAPTGPPEAYFKVLIQFYDKEHDTSSSIVYPPLGKHILAKFFYRGELSVLPGVFTVKNPDEAPPTLNPGSSFTSFAAREPSHVLSDLNTGWSVSWKKAGGGPGLMLDKACPLSTLQLSPQAVATGRKNQSVYAIAPFLTALGTNQRIMLAERLTLLPCADDAKPTASLFLVLAAKSLENDMIKDPSGHFIDAVQFGDIALPLSPRLPISVAPLLYSIHNSVTLGMFDIMTWTNENRARLLSSLRRLVALTLTDCESLPFDPAMMVASPLSIYNNPSYTSAPTPFKDTKAKQVEKKEKKKEKKDKEKLEKKQEKKDKRKEKKEKKEKKEQEKKERSLESQQREAELQKKKAEKKLLREQKEKAKLESAKLENGSAAEYVNNVINEMNSLDINNNNGNNTNGSAPSAAVHPAVASTASATPAASPGFKKVITTCLVCQNNYTGNYEQHIFSKEHANYITQGVTDKAEIHRIKFDHFTSVLQLSSNKYFAKQQVCNLCLCSIKRKKFDAHLDQCKLIKR